MSAGSKKDGMTKSELEELIVSYAKKYEEHSGAWIARKLGIDARYVQKILKKNNLQRTPHKTGNNNQKTDSNAPDRLQKKTVQRNTPANDPGIAMDEDAIMDELNKIFEREASANQVEEQAVEEPAEERPANRKKRSHPLDGCPRRRIDAWGNTRSTANLITMNIWNYGHRLSPRMINELKKEYALPIAYVNLIAHVDGAVPERDAFTVEIDGKKSKTYRLRFLLPAFNPSIKGEETIKEANEKMKDLHTGFIAFACVGKDSYLAFSQEESVFLLEKGKEIYVANDIVEFCGMLQVEESDQFDLPTL